MGIRKPQTAGALFAQGLPLAEAVTALVDPVGIEEQEARGLAAQARRWYPRPGKIMGLEETVEVTSAPGFLVAGGEDPLAQGHHQQSDIRMAFQAFLQHHPESIEAVVQGAADVLHPGLDDLLQGAGVDSVDGGRVAKDQGPGLRGAAATLIRRGVEDVSQGRLGPEAGDDRGPEGQEPLDPEDKGQRDERSSKTGNR